MLGFNQADAQWPEREGKPRESDVPEDKRRMLFKKKGVITSVNRS